MFVCIGWAFAVYPTGAALTLHLSSQSCLYSKDHIKNCLYIHSNIKLIFFTIQESVIAANTKQQIKKEDYLDSIINDTVSQLI